MHKSNFVLAFVPVYMTMVDTLKTLGANDDAIQRFTSTCAPRHLVSFGGAVTKQKELKDNYIEKALKHMNIIELREWFKDNIVLYIDSGGYQCGQGYVLKHEIPKFAEFYTRFLGDYYDYYDWAFSLDVPPNDVIFSSWDDVLRINEQTYKIVDQLPKHVKDKLIFVFHFRSPRIWDIWSKLALEFVNRYGNYWSVGGVAGFNVNNRMPCWLYTLPLVLFLNTFKLSTKPLYFHILGDFSWTTIFFSQLIPKAVKKFFGIDLTITYDATSIVTGNLKYRYLWDQHEDGYVDKVLIRKTEKHKTSNGVSNLERALNLLKDAALAHDFPVLDVVDIDRDSSDSFIPEVASYVVMQSIHQYWRIEEWCDKVSENLLDLYLDGKYDEFNVEVMNVLQKLHSGKLSKSIYTRRAYATTTLQILQNLDMFRCENLLDMLQDEFMFREEIPRW